MKNVTAMVITFLRDEYMFACVRSLRETYPDIKIIVGDNGHASDDKKKYCEKYGARYVELPFDCGICKGRNELAKLVDTEFVLIGDDDFLYTPEAQVDKMMETLKNNNRIDLIGGRIVEGGVVRNYQGFMELNDGNILYKRLALESTEYEIDKDTGMRFVPCDITFNYFVAHTDMIKAIRWDENIKVAYEHSDYFISLKKASKVVMFTPDAIVKHKEVASPKVPKEYLGYRCRRNDKEYFYTKHNLSFLVDMKGNRDVVGQADLRKVDFIIKTCYRHKCLERLLFSIAKFYPEANIYIGDDEKIFDVKYYRDLWERLFEAGIVHKPVAFNLGNDVGLAAGRNFLIKNSKNVYKLILDDDFVFTAKTRIEKMVRVLDDNKDIGVIGGMLTDPHGVDCHYEGRLVIDDHVLYYIPLDLKKAVERKNMPLGVAFYDTEIVFNFSIIRKEVFEDVEWDDRYKIAGEHTDFFIALKNTDWRIVYMPDVSIIHRQEYNPQYKKMRKRAEFWPIIFDKWDFDKIVSFHGVEYERKTNKEGGIIIKNGRLATQDIINIRKKYVQ